MAGLPELHSFIGKFVSLWQAGLDTSLTVKAHAGEARVHLQVGLGHAPPPPSAGCHAPFCQCPSRIRRRERRAKARKVAGEANRAEEERVAEEAIKSSTAVKTVEMGTTENDVTETVAVVQALRDKTIAEEAIIEDVQDELCPDTLYFEVKPQTSVI